jgi:hypothetical protein
MLGKNQDLTPYLLSLGVLGHLEPLYWEPVGPPDLEHWGSIGPPGKYDCGSAAANGGPVHLPGTGPPIRTLIFSVDKANT